MNSLHLVYRPVSVSLYDACFPTEKNEIFNIFILILTFLLVEMINAFLFVFFYYRTTNIQKYWGNNREKVLAESEGRKEKKEIKPSFSVLKYRDPKDTNTKSL